MKNLELHKDIIATVSILLKFEMCSVLDSQTLFIEFLNEAGFTTVKGKKFTKMSFRNMWNRLTKDELIEVLEEFKPRNYHLLESMM